MATATVITMTLIAIVAVCVAVVATAHALAYRPELVRHVELADTWRSAYNTERRQHLKNLDHFSETIELYEARIAQTDAPAPVCDPWDPSNTVAPMFAGLYAEYGAPAAIEEHATRSQIQEVLDLVNSPQVITAHVVTGAEAERLLEEYLSQLPIPFVPTNVTLGED